MSLPLALPRLHSTSSKLGRRRLRYACIHTYLRTHTHACVRAHEHIHMQVFKVRGDGQTTIASGGLIVTTGGATVTAGGAYIGAGGATVNAGGLKVNAGVCYSHSLVQRNALNQCMCVCVTPTHLFNITTLHKYAFTYTLCLSPYLQPPPLSYTMHTAPMTTGGLKVRSGGATFENDASNGTVMKVLSYYKHGLAYAHPCPLLMKPIQTYIGVVRLWWVHGQWYHAVGRVKWRCHRESPQVPFEDQRQI